MGVVLEFEAIAELDAVAAAVAIDFGDGCAGEGGVDISCDLSGDEVGGNLTGLAFDVTPVAFLVELYLVTVGVHYLVVVPVGGDYEGCLVGEVLLQHGLGGCGQTVEGDHLVVVGLKGQGKTDACYEREEEENRLFHNVVFFRLLLIGLFVFCFAGAKVGGFL